MPEFKPKPKGGQQQAKLPSFEAVPTKKLTPEELSLQRQQAQEWAIRHSIEQETVLQPQAKKTTAQPILRASAYRQEIEQGHRNQQELLHAQQGQLLQAHTPQALETALQREAGYALPERPPLKPQSNTEWVTVMRMQAAQTEGRWLSSREMGQFTALQRQITQTLIQRYKQDRQPHEARTAEYAEHLATLQRHNLSSPVTSAFMGFMPQGERPTLQRALDEAVQRQQDNTQTALLALNLHSIQRQLAELEEQSTLPILERIQQRRGAGNPLPEAIQRHLEQGLNHDLSAVRIHDDAEADKLSKGVNAIAFTTGTDIFFQSGKFNPNTQSGLELLAHEATHVVQQSKGQVSKGIDPDSGLETAAQESGKRLSLKTPIQPLKPTALQKLSPSRASGIQRKAAAPPSWNPTISKEALTRKVKEDLEGLLRQLAGNTLLDQTYYTAANRNNPQATPAQGKIFLDSLDHLPLSTQDKNTVLQAAIYKGTLPPLIRIDVAKAAVLSKRTDPTKAKNVINTLTAQLTPKGQVWDFGQAIASRLLDTIIGVYQLAKFVAWDSTPMRLMIDPKGYAQMVISASITVQAIRQNPRLIWDALTQDVRESWQKGQYGKALGYATFDIVSVATGVVGAARGAATVPAKMRVVVELAKDTSGRIVTKVVQVGDDVARGMGAGRLEPALATTAGAARTTEPTTSAAGMAAQNPRPVNPATGAPAASVAAHAASNAQASATAAATTPNRVRVGGAPTDPYAEEAVKQFGKLPSNWVDVKNLIGKPFDPSELPGPYTLSGKGSSLRINIPAGSKGITPLMVDMEGVLQLKTPGRLSIASKMRANYTKRFGNIPKGHWLHHLIPDNIIRNHTLGKILLKYGYDLDDASNLLAMADKEKYAELVKKNPKLIGHWSSHQKYDELVSNRLNAIQRELGIKTPNDVIPNDKINELKRRVLRLQDELRDLINSGEAPKDPNTGRLTKIRTSGDTA